MKLGNGEENVVIAREGVVKLLGDFRLAVVLEQLIYWSNKTRDYDKFLEEEIELINKDGGKSDLEKRFGWIYKTAQELSDELMGIGAPKTIAKDLVKLEELGYIESRNNPKYKWDHTKQYRPNYVKIQKDLLELGYIHEKIGISQSMLTEYTPISLREKSMALSERTIPETTTEITYKDIDDVVNDAEQKNSDTAEIFKAYESEIGMLTSFVRDDVLDAVELYPKDWIIEAIKVAAKNNARKWSYVEAVLKSWKVNGYKTDVRANKQNGKSKQPKSYLSPGLQKMLEEEKAERMRLYGGE